MISKEVVEQKLKEAINRYAGIVDPDLASDLLKSIDSLTKVEVILQLEDDFHVNVPEDEVDGWSVKEVIDFFMREGT